MRLLPGPACDSLITALARAGYKRWFMRVAGSDSGDPWDSFTAARHHADSAEGQVASLARLFILRGTVPVDVAEQLFGRRALHDMARSGLLQQTPDRVVSRYCLLVAQEKLLLVEYPSLSGPSGRWVTTDTYLSNSTYESLARVRRHLPAMRFLEMGAGTGLTSVVAASTGSFVVASDVDRRALRVAQANAEINGVTVRPIVADMFECFGHSPRFDLILFNPPWRLVPRTIVYPNPTARVGWGDDGMDAIRKFTRSAAFYLSPDGMAIVRADLPVMVGGCPFLRELEELGVLTGVKFRIIVQERIDVSDQSRSSAETAAFLNQELHIHELAEQFEANYRAHGFVSLWRGFIEIERGRGTSVEIVDEAAASVTSIARGGVPRPAIRTHSD